MHRHTRTIVEETLPRAKDLVAEGEQRLRAQEARVAELERKGRKTPPESQKLLKLLRETQALQINHVSLLEREVKADEDFVGDYRLRVLEREVRRRRSRERTFS